MLLLLRQQHAVASIAELPNLGEPNHKNVCDTLPTVWCVFPCHSCWQGCCGRRSCRAHLVEMCKLQVKHISPVSNAVGGRRGNSFRVSALHITGLAGFSHCGQTARAISLRGGGGGRGRWELWQRVPKDGGGGKKGGLSFGAVTWGDNKA